MMSELDALLLLTHLPLFGPIKIRLLIHHFGSAIYALEAPTSALTQLPGISKEHLDIWNTRYKRDGWKKTLSLAHNTSTQMISYQDPAYPRRLLELPDHPIVLYVKGNLLTKDQRSLAIIGTRKASSYGIQMTKQISKELAQEGFTIVSGLAKGIDIAAHEAALEGGRTIAVLGSGLGHIYPREHSYIIDSIAEKGAVISEYPIDTPPDRQQFPQRNRIVSGMTMGTILIEGSLKSGAMMTAEKAFGQKRPLFVLPGPADQENFQGNHELIKSRRGELIENSKDVIMFYSNLFNPFSYRLSNPVNFSPEKEEVDVIQQSKSVANTY